MLLSSKKTRDIFSKENIYNSKNENFHVYLMVKCNCVRKSISFTLLNNNMVLSLCRDFHWNLIIKLNSKNRKNWKFSKEMMLLFSMYFLTILICSSTLINIIFINSSFSFVFIFEVKSHYFTDLHGTQSDLEILTLLKQLSEWWN